VEEVKQMVTWKLKDCPRCGGDTFIDKDMDGWYQQCLLCAYRRELKELNASKRPLEKVVAGEEETD
jgi:ribosomal protein S27AE